MGPNPVSFVGELHSVVSFFTALPLFSTYLGDIPLYSPLRELQAWRRDVALEPILTEVQQTRLIMYMLLHYLSKTPSEEHKGQ